MSNLELYDIITIDNNSEYTILKIANLNNKKYYLLAPVDQNEEMDVERVKIVEEIIIDEKIKIQEVIEEKTLKELSKIFLSMVREDIEY